MNAVIYCTLSIICVFFAFMQAYRIYIALWEDTLSIKDFCRAFGLFCIDVLAAVFLAYLAIIA